MLSRKQAAIVVLVVVLVASNVALAILYMQKNVNISGGVEASGAIEVYDADGVTSMASISFLKFDGSSQFQTRTKFFFVNNTGNTPVVVYWNVSSPLVDWVVSGNTYRYEVGGVAKYGLAMNKFAIGYWSPSPGGTEENQQVSLDPGQGVYLSMDFTYTGDVSTPEDVSFVMSFYAMEP